jgi:hypothetical protein
VTNFIHRTERDDAVTVPDLDEIEPASAAHDPLFDNLANRRDRLVRWEDYFITAPKMAFVFFATIVPLAGIA